MSNEQPADHRKLGRSMKLFDSYDAIGSGFPIWLPDGAMIRSILERYVVDLERAAGYNHVYSPIVAKRELYERSGHWDHYKDDMFPPMKVGKDEIVLRPMLCPHHVLVYDSEPRSYRQLPVRIGEVGGQYRNELSGSLGGLSRVRGMALNDGHLFCREDQLEAEIGASLQLIMQASRDLGIDIARYRLSLGGSGDKYVDNPALWAKAERILRGVLDAVGLPYEAVENEAAFYGPKVDVQVIDAGRHEVSWSTVQLDLLLPQRFGLSYIGEDGRQHRPVMIHRSIVGAMERVVAHLIERWQGAFPFWLSPLQVAVLPVEPSFIAPASNIARKLAMSGLRAKCDESDGSLSERIRRAQLQKVPFVCVVGEREVQNGSVSVRGRDGVRDNDIPLDAFVSRLRELDASKRLDLGRG